MKKIPLLLLVFLQSGLLTAQLQRYNHPELVWRTIETEHFVVHFHEGTERTAAVTAKIAEEIFEPVTSLYEYKPDAKIHFIIRDHDDESNGAAFYYDNKIELWAPAIEFKLRGSHDWLRDVIGHEFSHMISLGAARKWNRQIPAVYFQWMDYEKEKRVDVLHGYPKTLVSFPVAGTVIPLWFAEGMAQFQRAGLGYDTWDSHRDMVLRTAILEKKLLTLREMELFSKTSLGNERVYNQGYGLVLYLAYRYGEDSIAKLVKAMRHPLRMNFTEAVQKVLGKSENELYWEWVVWLKNGYIPMEFPFAMKGFTILDEQGEGNFNPVLSPDGSQVACLSNRGRDYLSQTSLWLTNLRNGKKKKLKSGVTSSVSWSPDGKILIYAKKKVLTRHRSHFFDLYTYNLKEKKETRLTRGLRTREPDWSPDGRQIICIVEKDGTANLVLLDSGGSHYRTITGFKNGEQIYTPRWQDDRRIVFGFSDTPHGRYIAVIDTSGQNFQLLIDTPHDDRDPYPSPNQDALYFSSDRTGIFNLYRYDLSAGKVQQITNVSGGAFMPAVNKQGEIVFSLFRSDGYKLAYKNSLNGDADIQYEYRSPYQDVLEKLNRTKWEITDYSDNDIPLEPSKSYKPDYSRISFLPRIMLDYPGYKLKAGTYFYGSDVLDQVSILGGVALNDLLDTDIFGILEYRKFYPTLFVEAYQQLRHSSIANDDYTFNLMEVDAGMDWPVNDVVSLRTAYIFSRYHAGMRFVEQGQDFKFSYTYHIGSEFQLRLNYRQISRGRFSGIAPNRGRQVVLEVRHAWQRFIDDFKVHQDYGTLVETYSKYNYNQFMLDWQEYFPGIRKDHGLSLRLRGGLIDRKVDSFYHFFGGGLDGLKGYSYYSIEGRKLLQIGAAYRFPLFRSLNARFGVLQFDKLFLSLYGNMGNAWNEGGIDLNGWKRDAGVQMRLNVVTFYTYPLSIFFDAAYGLDGFTHMNNHCGEEWKFYFGILFDFLD